MKAIFQAFLKTLPFMARLGTIILLLSFWVIVLLTKLYKDDGYYCEGAYV